MKLFTVLVFGFIVSGCATNSLRDQSASIDISKATRITSAAAERANTVLAKICGRYQIVNAGFLVADAIVGARIPSAYRDVHQQAVIFLNDLCEHRPTDAAGVLEAGQKAYGTIMSIRDMI